MIKSPHLQQNGGNYLLSTLASIFLISPADMYTIQGMTTYITHFWTKDVICHHGIRGEYSEKETHLNQWHHFVCVSIYLYISVYLLLHPLGQWNSVQVTLYRISLSELLFLTSWRRSLPRNKFVRENNINIYIYIFMLIGSICLQMYDFQFLNCFSIVDYLIKWQIMK